MDQLHYIEALVLVCSTCYLCYYYGEYNIVSSLLISYILLFFYIMVRSYAEQSFYKYEKVPAVHHSIPHHVYTYLPYKEQMSPLQKKCIDSWVKQLPFYKIHVITNANWSEYTTLNPSVYHESYHTELIRNHILAERGGIWMDSFTFLHASLDWVHSYQYYEKSECIGIQDGGMVTWFMASTPTSLLKTYRDHFLQAVEQGEEIEFPDTNVSLITSTSPSLWLYPFYPLVQMEPVIHYDETDETILETVGMTSLF